MKYGLKGHKDRNRHKNMIKRNGQARLECTNSKKQMAEMKCLLPESLSWIRGTVVPSMLFIYCCRVTVDLSPPSDRQMSLANQRTGTPPYRVSQLVSQLVLRAQSTIKDYIRAEHKLHPICRLFISQVIIPQVIFLYFFFSLFIFRGHSTREPASSRLTYFILRAYTETSVSQSQHRKKSGEVLEKCR